MGSCRACCSEPRVRRGARAARVGTPRAPGPGRVRVRVRPPPALPPAPAPTPAPARAPRSAAAWGGSERSEQRAREGGGTEGGRELESERKSRAGEEKARPQNLGGGPSFREPGEDRGAPQQLPSAQRAARVTAGRRLRALPGRRPSAPALHHAVPLWVPGSG